MNAIIFTLPICPVAQQRARHTATGGIVRTYKAPEQRIQEKRLIAHLMQFRPPEPLAGPLLLGVKAYLAMPRCKSKKFHAGAEAGIIRPTTKPDLDNLIKHLKDCLTAANFWLDDRQVVGYLPETGKYYAWEPRWEIEIQTLEEQ